MARGLELVTNLRIPVEIFAPCINLPCNSALKHRHEGDCVRDLACGDDLVVHLKHTGAKCRPLRRQAEIPRELYASPNVTAAAGAPFG